MREMDDNVQLLQKEKSGLFGSGCVTHCVPVQGNGYCVASQARVLHSDAVHDAPSVKLT